MTDPVLAHRIVRPGETFGKIVRYTRDEILRFAEASHDTNPLHREEQASARARFGEVVASGQHTAAIMMGLVASHFSRRDDGIVREMLCLNFNFAFKSPVFADQDLQLQWRVSSVAWNSKLGGLLGQVDGTASTRNSRPAVIGRGTVLVREVV